MSCSSTHFARRSFLAYCASAAAAFSQEKTFVTAETESGRVRGFEQHGIKTFKGIPYGASTAGANRFMPPQESGKWTGIRDCLEWGPSAPQSRTVAASIAQGIAPGFDGTPLPREGEDCLVLNVWTPAINSSNKRPVIFWCHGGGFYFGTASFPIYDGANLARHGDVVVVSVNHRLNVMGFGYLGAFDDEFAASGAAGMLDIVRALEWVQANIAEFGGDPNQVMIFGQSGGGRKVETLLAMPSAKGLFHRAAIESGVAVRIAEREMAIRNAEHILAKLGIPKSNCRDLQKVPVQQLMAAYFDVTRESPPVDPNVDGFAPAVDGKIIPHHPFDPVASPVSPDVPVLIGCTRTEITLFLSGDPSVYELDEPGLQQRARNLIKADPTEVISVYRRANPNASPSDLFILIASDYRQGAPTAKITERRAALGKAPVYSYYFTWETPVRKGRLKSPHTIEIPFVFETTEEAADLTGGGPGAKALADKVCDAWVAFARTGDPNTGKMPHWPAFDNKRRPTMLIDKECKVVDEPLREQNRVMHRLLELS